MSIQPDKTSDAGELILGPPIRIGMEDLNACCCLECRAVVYHWPALEVHDGRAGTMDLETFDGQELLSLHGCHFELGPDEVDDPDFDWLCEP